MCLINNLLSAINAHLIRCNLVYSEHRDYVASWTKLAQLFKKGGKFLGVYFIDLEYSLNLWVLLDESFGNWVNVILLL